jgi:hypothetical protein
VKHDTCNHDCGVHDRCIQTSTARMRDGLNATGKPIVYYVDDGNDSSGPRLYNPFGHRINKQQALKIAVNPSELVWYWVCLYSFLSTLGSEHSLAVHFLPIPQ